MRDNGFDRAQAAYEAMLPPEYDNCEGYCDLCDNYNDKHDEYCDNYGTTEEERIEEGRESYEEAKAELAYEALKEQDDARFH